MFNNSVFVSKINKINCERNILGQNEYDIHLNWINELNIYLMDAKYIRINDNIFVMINKTSSNIYKILENNVINPMSVFEIYGLVVNTNKKLINEGFCDHIHLKLTDNVTICSEDDFKQAFETTCSIIFSDNEENFIYQYKNYYSLFYECIYIDYKYMFPEYVDTFMEKIEYDWSKSFED